MENSEDLQDLGMENLLKNEKKQEKEKKKREIEIPIIPGIFHEIYKEILENSPIPRHQTAYAATLATMSAIIGRTASLFSIMPTMRQFVVMPTAFGKGIIGESLQLIFAGLGLEGIIGSSHISSETSLLSEFEIKKENPEILAICDEGHQMLKTFSHFGGEDIFKKLATIKYGMLLPTKRIVSIQGLKRTTNIGAGVKSPFYNFIAMTTPEGLDKHWPSDAKTSGLSNRLIIWQDMEFKRRKIPKSNCNFTKSINALNQIKYICFVNERIEAMREKTKKENKKSMFKEVDNHHHLIMEKDAEIFWKLILELANDKLEKNYKLNKISKFEERIVEQVIPLVIICHVSINKEKFAEIPIHKDVFELSYNIAKKIMQKSFHGRDQFRKKQKDKIIITKVVNYLKKRENGKATITQICQSLTHQRKHLKKAEIENLVFEKILCHDGNKTVWVNDAT